MKDERKNWMVYLMSDEDEAEESKMKTKKITRYKIHRTQWQIPNEQSAYLICYCVGLVGFGAWVL